MSRILVEAGTSNTVALSRKDALVARFLLSALELETPALTKCIGQDQVGYMACRLKVALAPHKHLPLELLVKIFRYVGYGTPLFYPPCDPVLWRDICIRGDVILLVPSRLEYSQRYYHHQRQIDFWNENIAKFSQSLRISVVDSPNSMVSKLVYLGLLRSNAKRITEIFAGGPRSLLFDFIAILPSDSAFSSLKRLCCYSYYFHMIRNGDLTMPQLTNLEVYINNTWNSATRPNIAWGSLTDLVLCTYDCGLFKRRPHRLSMAEILATLKLCRGLRHCTLQVDGFLEGNSTSHSPINLPHLQSLRIYQIFISGWQNVLLDFLIAPSLIALEFYETGTHSVGLSDIVPFIYRSKCNLEDMILDSEKWTIKEDCSAKAFFELTPSLRTFYAPNNVLYHGLIPVILNTTLLPMIERIGVSIIAASDDGSIGTTRTSIQSQCCMVFYHCKPTNRLKSPKSSRDFALTVIPWDDQMEMQRRFAIFAQSTGMNRGWNDTSEGHFWFD
ncbi:hypothetical protein H0H93_008263 [Arthromyces matolae]|nr:hypothetical protein H0H93_008263 [Arthromyces matolae]